MITLEGYAARPPGAVALHITPRQATRLQLCLVVVAHPLGSGLQRHPLPLGQTLKRGLELTGFDLQIRHALCTKSIELLGERQNSRIAFEPHALEDAFDTGVNRLVLNA